MNKYISKILLSISILFGLTTISSVKYNPLLEGVEISTNSKDENSKDGFQIIIGQSIDLFVKYFPENASSKKLTWSSSDDSILSVDEKGKVTSKGIGEATIKVQADKKSAEFTIEVLPVYVSSINLSYTYEEIAVGQNGKIQVSVYPSTATDTSISWVSETPNLISVDQEGNFEVLSAGNGRIRVDSNDGNTSSYIDFTIKNEIYPSSISVFSSINSPYINWVEVGSSVQMYASLSPDNITVKDVSWSVSNSSIATIDQNGCLKALGEGTVTVTATTANGLQGREQVSIDRTWEIVVKDEDGKMAIYNPTLGSTYQMVAYYLVGQNKLFNKPVTWTSSNESVATVDDSGLVTIVGTGWAIINAVSYGVTSQMGFTIGSIS